MLKIFKRYARSICCFAVCLFAISAVRPAQAAGKTLKIITKEDGDTINFLVENLDDTEVTATFTLEMTNLKCNQTLPYTCTLPAHKITEPFTLAPVKRGVTWKYNYTSQYTIGSSVAEHDDKYVYLLPFAPAAAYRVSQGYNGTFSHSGPDQYAIDFKMPIGTPVHAARQGVVVKVKMDSDLSGPNRKYQNDANYILIRHSDGTLANYAHLTKNGVVVKAGQEVNAGDLIGYSGNSGFTSGPHLHFSVFKTKSGSQRETIPVRFKTANSTGVTLVEGSTYKSFPNGRSIAPTIAILPTIAGSHKTALGAGAPGPKSGVE
jgi:hypothetical protein